MAQKVQNGASITPSGAGDELVAIDESAESLVIFDQLAGIIRPGQVYYTVRLPDGQQTTFPDEEEAVRYAARTGGVVVARPTRAALRMAAAASGATAVQTPVTVTVTEGVVHIDATYMSLVMVPSGSETTVIALSTVEVKRGQDRRVMPAVGAASTDEFRGKQADRPAGQRLANAAVLAATRAKNRGIADLTGLVDVGETIVRRARSPQEQVVQLARELGLLGRVHKIIGTRLDQITEETLPGALNALREAASKGSDSEGEGQ